MQTCFSNSGALWKLCRKECVDLLVNVLYCGNCENSCDNFTQVTLWIAPRWSKSRGLKCAQKVL